MEDFWYIWVLPVVGGIIWWLISNAMVKAPGQVLASKIAKVQQENGGKIAGVPYSKIVAACGAPSAVSAVGDGTTLKQWQATSYGAASECYMPCSPDAIPHSHFSYHAS